MSNLQTFDTSDHSVTRSTPISPASPAIASLANTSVGATSSSAPAAVNAAMAAPGTAASLALTAPVIAERALVTPPPMLLSSLPQEVHDAICRTLPSTRDVKALRATNREFRDKTDKVWLARQFESIIVDLTAPKLGYLIEVSENERFSGQVKVMAIHAACVPSPGQKQYCPTMDRVQDILCVQVKKRIVPSLTELYLPVGPSHQPGDMLLLKHALGRLKELGCLEIVPDGEVGGSRVFSVVLGALENAGSNLKQVKAGALPVGQQRYSIDHMRLYLPHFEAAPHSMDTLANLENLQLTLQVHPGSLMIGCGRALATFLRATTHLKNLRLEFWFMASDWLAETLQMTFPHLESLHLEAARRTSAKALCAFIQAHKGTLKDVTLANIKFCDDDLTRVVPKIFRGLQLRSVRLQQLCGREGLLLLGVTLDSACAECYRDLDSVWRSCPGLACAHATLIAEGETEIGQTIEKRLETVSLLPWLISGRGVMYGFSS